MARAAADSLSKQPLIPPGDDAAQPLDPPAGTPLPSPLWTRVCCALGAVAWVAAFVWLWTPATGLAKVLGLAWFALGLASPAACLFSLALAFPWFGNQPGLEHNLFLIDLALMGLVTRHLAARAAGRRHPRYNALDPWVFLFVFFSWVTLAPEWRWIRCELLTQKAHFLYQVYHYTGDADVSGVQMILKLTLGAGLYVALRDNPWPAARVRKLWGALLAGLAFTAVIGWLNYVGWLSLAWWRADNPDITRFGYRRLQSLYYHSGWFAQYIEALAPGALAFGWTARRPAARWTLWGLAAFLALTQLFTMQRAGWIGLAGGYGVVIALASFADSERRNLRKLGARLGALAGAGALAILLFVLLSPVFRHRLGELFAYYHRTTIWHAALGLFRTSPWGGVGLGFFFTAHTFLFPPGHPFWFLDKITAHNLYLHILAERGVLGLGFYLTLLGLTLWRLARPLLRRRQLPAAEAGEVARLRPLQLAVLGGLTALSLDGLFQYFFFVRVIEILFWMLLGWAAWLGPTSFRPSRRVWGWIALAQLALAVVVLENTFILARPCTVPIDQINFLIGEKTVALPLPYKARRVRLQLACVDPDTRRYPVTFTLRLAKKVLKTIEFKGRPVRVDFVLDLPPDRLPPVPLTVEASRTWSPWGYGLRVCPVLTMGVLYLPALPAGDPSAKLPYQSHF